MAFSGHETFPVREGWLHKGLKLLVEEPELLVDEYSHDWLGVGKNMSRSIKYWLVVTGIAHRESTKKAAPLTTTPLGELIWERDPYFNEPGTLWALHVNLLQPGSFSESWVWFFNEFNLARFEKSVCIETLRRHLDMTVKKVPSHSTLERDMGCLLSCYSRQIPALQVDPEEALECPFRELGLMSYFRASGYYQVNQGVKDIPPELVGYALACGTRDFGGSDDRLSIPVTDAARLPGGPARAFVLTPETLFEMVTRAEDQLDGEIQISGLAGNRTIVIDRRDPILWLTNYYTSLTRGNRYAA